MEVRHPKEGAVYWEGPVNVDLEVTLSGERTSYKAAAAGRGRGLSQKTPLIAGAWSGQCAFYRKRSLLLPSAGWY